MKKAKSTRADGQATREAIFDAAADEFAAKGYELASVRTICAKAGANVALANRYFGSKENLYRLVAKRLFGDLGAPLAKLADGVTDEASWRAAVRTWIDDFLFMTLPTKKAQKRCAALFRNEVTHPTAFQGEFRRLFGKPVYDSLRKLLAYKIKDEVELGLWTSSVWAQVSVYALADKSWHKSFRPKGMGDAEWTARIRDHIVAALAKKLERNTGVFLA
jgi:AcrR family transcriptional regulator